MLCRTEILLNLDLMYNSEIESILRTLLDITT